MAAMGAKARTVASDQEKGVFHVSKEELNVKMPISLTRKAMFC